MLPTGAHKVRVNCSTDVLGIYTVLSKIPTQPIPFNELFAFGLREYILKEDFSFVKMQKSDLERETSNFKERVKSVSEKLSDVTGKEIGVIEFLMSYKEAGKPIIMGEGFYKEVWEKELNPSEVKAAIGRLMDAGVLVPIAEEPAPFYDWKERVENE